MLNGISIALAGAVGIALLAGPVAGQDSSGELTLRVPVKLKNMIAKKARVDCVITRGEALTPHTRSEWKDIVNGEFDQVIDLVMKASLGKSFRETDKYICRLELPGGTLGISNGYQGTPSGPDDPQLPNMAKPDQFFRNVSTGALVPSKEVVDGIVGPKDLTIGPKSKP
jgi:hypothetical protein